MRTVCTGCSDVLGAPGESHQPAPSKQHESFDDDEGWGIANNTTAAAPSQPVHQEPIEQEDDDLKDVCQPLIWTELCVRPWLQLTRLMTSLVVANLHQWQRHQHRQRRHL